MHSCRRLWRAIVGLEAFLPARCIALIHPLCTRWRHLETSGSSNRFVLHSLDPQLMASQDQIKILVKHCISLCLVLLGKHINWTYKLVLDKVRKQTSSFCKMDTASILKISNDQPASSISCGLKGGECVKHVNPGDCKQGIANKMQQQTHTYALLVHRRMHSKPSNTCCPAVSDRVPGHCSYMKPEC